MISEKAKETVLRVLERSLVLPQGVNRFYSPVLLPGKDNIAQKLWEKAISLNADEAKMLLEEIVSTHKEDPTAVSSIGFPLQPLACWNLLGMERYREKISERLTALIQSAVYEHLSILTPELLSKTEALFTKRGVSHLIYSELERAWKH